MSDTLDLPVIGAGACGLAAAIAAPDAGGPLAIVEKRATPVGNLSLSTGLISGAGLRFQGAAGIRDSAERMVEGRATPTTRLPEALSQIADAPDLSILTTLLQSEERL